MKKACVIGHFGLGENLLNGQTIKTKIITKELENKYGIHEIKKIDTHGGIKSLPKIIMQMVSAFVECENVLIFPAHNGVKVFVPLCVILKKIFRRRIHYVVIGGWLPNVLKKKVSICRGLRAFDKVYVETSTLKKKVEAFGINQVVLLPNFKKIEIVKENDLSDNVKKPYKLCIFSRVMKEKGIEDAIKSIKEINERNGKEIYTLDIYGQIEDGQKEWFDELKKTFPVYIRYKGLVEYDKSVSVLKDYFALLFPTRFYTEGVPGTIIDAYAAGIPVISSKWESFEDLIDDGFTGIGYEFLNTSDLIKKLNDIALEPDTIISKKINCVKKAKEYQPENVMNKMYEFL